MGIGVASIPSRSEFKRLVDCMRERRQVLKAVWKVQMALEKYR